MSNRDNRNAAGKFTDEYIAAVLRTIQKAPEWAREDGRDPEQAQLDQLRSMLAKAYAEGRRDEYEQPDDESNPYHA